MIRVLGDRVLVLLPPRETETVSEGGIVLTKDPDAAKAPTRGIVMALGEKLGTVEIDAVMTLFDEVLANEEKAEDFRGGLIAMRPAAFDVALGDLVLFPASAGDLLSTDGVDYVVLHEAEILGVLTPLSKTEAA